MRDQKYGKKYGDKTFAGKENTKRSTIYFCSFLQLWNGTRMILGGEKLNNLFIKKQIGTNTQVPTYEI